jgi:predicted anti-sigma-YlaC factor YlaD
LPARCERARKWISRRLDGDLSELEGALLETHLELCVACRTFGDDVAAITFELRRAQVALTERPSTPARRQRRLTRPAAAVAAAAAVVVTGLVGALGFGGISGGSQPPRRPTYGLIALRDDTVPQSHGRPGVAIPVPPAANI